MPPLVRRPDLPTDTAIDRSAWSDDFDAPALSPEWIWLRGSNRHGWSALNSGERVLRARPAPAGRLGQPAFVGRRLRHVRKRVVWGRRVYVRFELGGRTVLKQQEAAKAEWA